MGTQCKIFGSIFEPGRLLRRLVHLRARPPKQLLAVDQDRRSTVMGGSGRIRVQETCFQILAYIGREVTPAYAEDALFASKMHTG